MPGFSNSLANNIVNNTLRAAAAATVRNTYFALFTADPTDAFTNGTEVAAAWYARVTTGAFAAPTNGSTYNSTRREFAPVTGAPLTVTHIGIVEGANPTDGTATLLYSFALSAPKVLAINDVYVVDSTGSAGDFTLNLI